MHSLPLSDLALVTLPEPDGIHDRNVLVAEFGVGREGVRAGGLGIWCDGIARELIRADRRCARFSAPILVIEAVLC